MANVIFTGGATPVAQEDRFTPGGTIEIGDKFLIVLTAEDGTTTQTISAVATGTTVSSTVADLLAAWDASTASLKAGITGSNQASTYFRLLGTSGTPFYAAASTTENDDSPADAQTFVRAATTANVGPADLNTASNYAGGAKPVANDIVWIDPTAGDILYGLNQSGYELDGFHRPLAHEGHIGDGVNYLHIDVENGKPVEIDYHYGPALTAPTRRTMIKVKDRPITTVHNAPTSTGEEAGPTTRFLFNDNAAVFNVLGGAGYVGIAVNVPGETSSLGTLNVFTSGSDPSVILGPEVTIVTINKVSGTLVSEALPTTLKHSGGTSKLVKSTGTLATINQDGGTIDTVGGFAITAVNQSAGTLNSNSTGTITNLTLSGGAVADFLKSNAARTVTAITISGAFTLKADSGVIAATNKINLVPGKPMRIVATAA